MGGFLGLEFGGMLDLCFFNLILVGVFVTGVSLVFVNL